MTAENIDVEVEDDLEIVIEDDTPEEDKGKALLPEDADEDETQTEEQELANVGDRVRKRIDKLTAEKHDSRRKAEAAQRERDEAARALQIMLERENAYKAQLLQYEGGFVQQAKGRVEAELLQARNDFKSAYELGDADKMADAQERLARLAPQHEQYSRYKPAEAPAAPPAQTYAPPVQRQYDPQPDDNLAAFMKANPWFNQDEEMTAFAMGLHQQAALKDPASVGTVDYYDDIAAKVKKAFGKEEAAPARKPASAAPVTRGAPSTPARKQVTLSASQVRLAARLGLTPKQYAESLLEQEKNQ